MKRMSAGVVTAIVAVVLVLGVLNLQGIVPRPEQYAAATITIEAGKAQVARYQTETSATAIYLEERKKAVPTQVATEDQTNAARTWGLTGGLIGSIIAAIVVFVLIGGGVAAITRRKSHEIPRDKTGQLGGLLSEDGTKAIDLQRSVGVVDFAESAPDIASEQWTVVAQSANQTAAVAALMRPGITQQDKSNRLQFVKQNPVRDPYDNIVKPGMTSIEVNGDAVLGICQNLGLVLASGEQAAALPNPDHLQIEAPVEELPGAVRAWTEVGVEKK